ncbi:MAG: antitoxin component YwqK of YwqJK toxin-antitoxin module [Cyclobacteriaceae bacterium]|jgi:antitoxin component YwqK of YwqJK toxin-antitoxin module
MRRLASILTASLLWFTSAGQVLIQKTYFDAEQTKIKEIISLNSADSTLEGLYQSFYANRSLATKGYYHYGESDSIWVFYFENGSEKAKGKYHLGKQTDKWIYFFENGNKKAEGLFKDNIKHGPWTYFFENNTEKSSGVYFDGKKEGIWNFLYEEGSLKAQAYYDHGNGIYKEFYPTGTLKMEGHNEDEESEGLWTYYFDTGEKEAEGKFVDGLRDGYWQHFHKNEQLAAEGNFAMGEKSGIWKYYYPDGSVSSEGEMKQDQKDGFWKLYYQSGVIKGEGKYDVGTGEYVEFYESGNQKARGLVKNGKKNGKWIYYSEDGVEDGIAVYKEGVGDYQNFYPDGTIKMKGKLNDDRRIGEWTLYNPDGSIAGVYRPVYENEKPIFRTSESIKADIEKKELPDKPEYKYKSNKLRYFQPRVNEFRGYIIATNPLWTMVDELPIAIEYYLQERLGYEMQLNLVKKPFFSEASINNVNTKGGIIDFRQKFYHDDKKLGMFYFGHQLSGGYLLHQVIKLDSSISITDPKKITLKATESQIGYGVFIGNRWMQRAGNGGFTVDFHIGISVASRTFRKEYAPSEVNELLFKKLNQDDIFFPIIFGINIGFSGPKRALISL